MDERFSKLSEMARLAVPYNMTQWQTGKKLAQEDLEQWAIDEVSQLFVVREEDLSQRLKVLEVADPRAIIIVANNDQCMDSERLKILAMAKDKRIAKCEGSAEAVEMVCVWQIAEADEVRQQCERMRQGKQREKHVQFLTAVSTLAQRKIEYRDIHKERQTLLKEMEMAPGGPTTEMRAKLEQLTVNENNCKKRHQLATGELREFDKNHELLQCNYWNMEEACAEKLEAAKQKAIHRGNREEQSESESETDSDEGAGDMISTFRKQIKAATPRFISGKREKNSEATEKNSEVTEMGDEVDEAKMQKLLRKKYLGSEADDRAASNAQDEQHTQSSAEHSTLPNPSDEQDTSPVDKVQCENSVPGTARSCSADGKEVESDEQAHMKQGQPSPSAPSSSRGLNGHALTQLIPFASAQKDDDTSPEDPLQKLSELKSQWDINVKNIVTCVASAGEMEAQIQGSTEGPCEQEDDLRLQQARIQAEVASLISEMEKLIVQQQSLLLKVPNEIAREKASLEVDCCVRELQQLKAEAAKFQKHDETLPFVDFIEPIKVWWDSLWCKEESEQEQTAEQTANVSDVVMSERDNQEKADLHGDISPELCEDQTAQSSASSRLAQTHRESMVQHTCRTHRLTPRMIQTHRWQES